MRHMRLSTLGLALLTLMLSAAVLGPLGYVAAQPGPQPQPQPPGPADPAHNVSAMIFGDSISYQTVPSSFVRADVYDDQGRVVASGNALADETGLVTIGVNSRGGGRPGGGRQAAAILPGYEIRLTPTGASPVAVTVPDLAIGADLDTNRVVGRGPAGETIALTVWMGPDPSDEHQSAVSVDATGSFASDQAAPVVLAPGVSGSVAHTDANANTFTAAFHVLEADVTIGAREAGGQATLGTRVLVTVLSADGSVKGSGNADVLGTPAWSVSGGVRQNQFPVIETGDTISVTQVATLPGTSVTLVGVIPELTIDVNIAGDAVEGRAPAGSRLEIVLTSPYGEVVSRTATGGADGTYRLDLEDVTGFGRGWRAEVRHAIVPGLRVSSYQVTSQVRVGVHSSEVNGVSDPGRLITITVRTSDGSVKASGNARANAQGLYQTSFTADDRIAVGDAVEVEFVAGDPTVVRVEAISARTDVAADVVSGVAPAGTSVRISQGAGSNQVVHVTTADASSEYRAEFEGELDIVAPMSGDVVVRLPSGHELFTTWAAVQMTMELGETFLTGNGPAGRLVSAELVAPDGTVVATGSDSVGGAAGQAPVQPGRPGTNPGQPGTAGTPRWNLDFVDTLGATVAIRAGDTVRVVVGDDSFVIVVPPLMGVAFVADDIVNGTTTPDRAVSLRVQRQFTGENASVDLTADAGGSFSHDFTDEFDLQHNDAILFTTLELGHIVNSRLTVPGLRLDLDLGVLVGSWRPNAQVAYELRSTSGVRSSGTARADEQAVFRVQLEDDTGVRTVPAIGDVVEVEPLEGEPDAPLVLTVPELTIEWDVESDAIGGRASAGGGLVFTVTDAVQRAMGGAQTRRVRPEIGADATYVVALSPPYDVVPGTEMQALYRLASGHLVNRTRYVPIVNAQHGGANVCGFTNPRDLVPAVLQDSSGAAIAEGQSQAGYGSRFALQLRDDAGAFAVSGDGEKVVTTLDDERIELDLPPLSVTVDWENGMVTGTGPAQALFQVLRPARGCLETDFRNATRGRVNQRGAFTIRIPDLDPGQGFEIAFFTDEGHRYYRHVFRSLGQIWVNTEVVTGRTTPSSLVELVLTDAGGNERGRTTATADPNGGFLARFLDGDGEAIAIHPEDKVVMSASGETPEIVVEELAFDWSPGEAIVGSAPPNREVLITVRLTSGPNASFTLLADARGVFRFGREDVPPRSDWDLDDVEAVRAMIDTPNGHNIIAGTEPPTGPVEPPAPVRAGTVYLPRVMRGG